MDDEKRDLAEEIASADRERQIWWEGRTAGRERRECPDNPYPPQTPEHRLWSEGFAYEHGSITRTSHWW